MHSMGRLQQQLAHSQAATYRCVGSVELLWTVRVRGIGVRQLRMRGRSEVLRLAQVWAGRAKKYVCTTQRR